MRYLTSAHPNLVWRAMLTGEPYPVRALIVMGSNPLLTQADARLVYQALKSLDLLVALEYFMTPTAMLADYILPARAGWSARCSRPMPASPTSLTAASRLWSLITSAGAISIFWRELGLRLGQAEHWPWKTLHESLEDTLAPAGDHLGAVLREAGCITYPARIKSTSRSILPRVRSTALPRPAGRSSCDRIFWLSLGYRSLPTPCLSACPKG